MSLHMYSEERVRAFIDGAKAAELLPLDTIYIAVMMVTRTWSNEKTAKFLRELADGVEAGKGPHEIKPDDN